MKKILAITLAVVIAAFTFAGCGDTNNAAQTLKFGMGISASYEAYDATEEADGSGEVISTVAAVLVDADGKVVKCVIDATDSTVGFTADGTAYTSEYTTKLEAGDNYGMAAWGTDLNGDGVVLEWYDQAEAFCDVCVGKTSSEVAALVVNGYGTDEVQNAGCTIAISDFANAVVKAITNATESDATASDTLNIGIVTTAEASDASEEADGTAEIISNYVAVALDADGKVVASSTDCLDVTFTFTTAGVSTTAASEASTKREAGDNYGMAAWGSDLNGDGVVLEWYAQADAFDASLEGLTASEIAALVVNGYGIESVQTAGCTIAISDMVAAAVKAATIG